MESSKNQFSFGRGRIKQDEHTVHALCLGVGTVGADNEESGVCVCLSLFTYCSPASWPQSQSEVSVESAGAWGEEEER